MRLPGLTRAFLMLLACLATHSQGRCEGAAIVGHVLDLQGDWRLFDPGDDESAGRPLQKWQSVAAQGVIRLKSPATGDLISIVDRDLKVIVSRNCRVLATCYQPLYLPAGPHQTSLVKEALGSVWEFLWDESYRQSLHRVRQTTGRMSEGIAAIADGDVDLKDAMAGMRSGRYVSAPRRSSATPGAGREIEFDWNPEKTTIVQLGEQPPGLYEITRAATADRLYQNSGPSAYVLICDPRECPDVVSSFQRARAAAKNWESAARSAAIHQFLRAVLVELSKDAAARKQ